MELPAKYFVYEPVAGLLPTLPWSWFAPVALVAAARATWRTRGITPFAWAVGATALAATAALGPCLVLATATNRYLGDAVGSLVLLAALGVGAAHEAVRARPRLRKLILAAAFLLAIPSIGMGLALGVRGPYAHFRANNPPLYQKLVQRLSVCHGQIPPEPN
jgi:small-conductance mechanosensitive channel